MEKFYDGDQARLFDEAHIVNPYKTKSDAGKKLLDWPQRRLCGPLYTDIP